VFRIFVLVQGEKCDHQVWMEEHFDDYSQWNRATTKLTDRIKPNQRERVSCDKEVYLVQFISIHNNPDPASKLMLNHKARHLPKQHSNHPSATTNQLSATHLQLTHANLDIMTLQLSGTAFITGAGSGIGQATAIAFAEHGVGNFALADLKGDGLVETIQKLKEISKDVKTLAIEMDVSKEADVAAAIKATLDMFGSLNYAVNNAGIGGPLVPTGEMAFDAWQRCIDVNLNVGVRQWIFPILRLT
jgi:hypothetical protein